MTHAGAPAGDSNDAGVIVTGVDAEDEEVVVDEDDIVVLYDDEAGDSLTRGRNGDSELAPDDDSDENDIMQGESMKD